ncbi:MAG TPA: DUF5655 domain-containing protein [Acidimicrobiales bacterium]|nr:DUF5655 domain-containing protein [Acidimicrobiales bacterium]
MYTNKFLRAHGEAEPQLALMARTWEDMRDRITAQLLRETGHDLGWWNKEIAASGTCADGDGLRSWLARQGVGGYPAMLLGWETFGYPEYLLASADELIDAQYADRPALRPILDAVLAVTAGFGEVDVQARKTYTCLLTPRRTFAAVRPTTRTRTDLALRLDGVEPGGRLLDGSSTAGGGINLRVALSSPEDLDEEAIALLRRAYEGSL